MFSLSWDFCNTQEQLKLSSNFFVVGGGGGAKQGEARCIMGSLKVANSRIGHLH